MSDPEINWSHELADGDLCLISADNIGFRMSSDMLTHASVVFSDMISMPRPEDDQNSGPLRLTDPSEQLLPLFLLLASKQVPEDIVTMERILIVADKYQMPGVIKIITQLLQYHGSLTIKAHPMHAYVLACQFGLSDIRAEAMNATMDVDLDDDQNSVLAKRLPLKEYHVLHDSRVERREKVVSQLRYLEGPSNAVIPLLLCEREGCSHLFYPSAGPFLAHYRAAMFVQLTRRPSGIGITDTELASEYGLVFDNKGLCYCRGKQAEKTKVDFHNAVCRYLLELVDP